MDGPEVIMDAEEYLQPKARDPLPSVSTVDTPLPQTPVKKTGTPSTPFRHVRRHPPSCLSAALTETSLIYLSVCPGSAGNGSCNGSEQGTVYGAEGFSSQGSHVTASPVSSSSRANQGSIRRSDNAPHLRYCSDPLQLIGKGGNHFLHPSITDQSIEMELN